MKKINKKGFTLIELLAVIIILGVLLLIAVPSVSKYILQSRQKTYKTNLSKFVDEVSAAVNSMDYDSPYSFNSTEYLVVPIRCIELERGSNEKSPFAAYEVDKSFVVVERKADGSGFNYYVTAKDVNGYGTSLAYTDRVDIKTVTNDEVGKITANTGTPTTYTVSFGTTVINAPTITGLTPKVITCSAFTEVVK